MAARADYDELITRWVAFAQVKPTSVRSYTKGVRNFFAFAAAQNLHGITRDALLAYRANLAALVAEGKYKPSTANLYLVATRLFTQFLYSEGILPVNPAEHLKGLKVERGHAKDPLSTDATRKIIGSFDTSTLKGIRDRAMYTLMTTCGCRCVEVARANVEDIVDRRGKTFFYLQGKGRDDRTECVEVPSPVLKMIRAYLDAREQAAGASLSPSSPLFASVSNRNKGGRLSTTSISRVIKTAFRANGFDSPRLTAHSLRHTAATTMIEHGVSLRQVQECLRHKSLCVTQVYLDELDRFNNNAECVAAAAFGL